MRALTRLPGIKKETRPRWHGYALSECQWLLSPDYRDLSRQDTCLRLLEDFSAGRAQIRMRLTGVNVEQGVPDLVYACKYKPDRDTFFLIRIDQATGKPVDIGEERAGKEQAGSGGWQRPILGEQALSDLMATVFEKFAHWHCNSFGPGPIAPTVDERDPHSVAQMESWAQARYDQIAQRTAQAVAPKQTGPRL